MMTPQHTTERRPAVVWGPGEGRHYAMGGMSAVFKADGDETQGSCSISEWWLEPMAKGPGPHSHPEDDVFYVIEGTVSVLVDDHWVDAPRGAFVLVPGGVTHDFENRTPARAGLLNVSTPGNFEKHMPSIVEWFQVHGHGHR
jgi:mannose-6-phosphate isomerase-like protein (cupin superfamily)